jgi:MFS family permease
MFMLVSRRRRRAPFLAFRALRVRNYRLYALGNLVSITGTWMQLVAQNWLVLRLTGSGTALGVTIALQAIPGVLFSLHGGAIADRFPKRRVLVATQAMLALLAAALATLVATGAVELWMVYALAVAVGCVCAVDLPTGAAFGTELVAPEDLPNAAALGAAANSMGRIVGMALAGIAVATVGVAPVFLANAVSYLAVVAALLAVRPAEMGVVHGGGVGDRRIRHAFRAIRRVPVVVGTLVLAFVVAAFGRNYQLTMATMSMSVFHRGASGYGTLSTVFAVGAFAGALVAARLTRVGMRVLIAAAAAAGALELMAATMPDLGTFAACILPIAVAAVVIDTALGVVVALGVDHGIRGRALALLAMASTGGAAIGGPLLGWSVQHLGTRLTLGAAGVTSLVAALAIGGALTRVSAMTRDASRQPSLAGLPSPPSEEGSVHRSHLVRPTSREHATSRRRRFQRRPIRSSDAP